MALSPVDAFLARTHRLWIGGAWVAPSGGGRLPSVNPATGAVLTEIAAGTAADIDAAVAAARQALEHESWAAMKPAARSKLLWRIADLIEANAAELAELEYLDNGKPRHVAATGDVPGAAEVFRYYAGWCTKIFGRTLALSRPGVQHAYTLKEPVGVVGLITPWNFPLLMAAWKLAPALAAGCTCVLKPAEETSLTALRLAELIAEAGMPAGVVNVVTGLGHVTGAALTAHPGVDKIAFTGSTEIGRRIVQAATGNLKKLSLELGGKSPTVIFDDADLRPAIAAAAMGIFFNAGQVCAAGSRLYVQRGVFEQVLDGVIAAGRAIRLGPGDDPSANMGPLISAKQRQRVSAYVEDGVGQGAELRLGGSAPDRDGWFYQPTILTGTRPDMRVVQEEIFGPVLVIEPFGDADEAVRLANNSIYGLSATVWTRDLSAAHGMARRLQAGAIRINGGGGNDPNLPFGGYKQSGWGREFGEDGLELYLQTKSVVANLG